MSETTINRIQNDVLNAAVIEKNAELLRLAMKHYKETINANEINLSELFVVYTAAFEQFKEINQYVYNTKFFTRMKRFAKLNFKQFKDQLEQTEKPGN